MKISDFELYRDLLRRHSGLSLTAERSYLLDSRLTPVARKWGYPTLDAMTLALRGVPESKLVEDVIEGMMTGDTSFFRDAFLFQDLGDRIIPHFMKTRGRRHPIRIWSAGCSTGQEPFSIALTVKNAEAKHKGLRTEILGTDISHQALTKAKTGFYTQFEVQRGLPVRSLIMHFDEVDDGWILHDDVTRLVEFEHFNILDSFEDFGVFDIIFCRNVLTYFEPQMRAAILTRMSEQLEDGGILYIGQDETIDGIDTPFEFLDRNIGMLGLTRSSYTLETKKQAGL